MPGAAGDVDLRPARHLLGRLDALGGRDPWRESMPAPQRLPDDLIEQGRTIPVARVAAMHEGKRRARARREQSG